MVLAAGQSALLAHAARRPSCSAPANAALQTVREALRLVAPVAGAGLYTVAGGGAVAILDAATFLLATGALLALQAARAQARTRRHDHWLRATAAGARAHRAHARPQATRRSAARVCMLVIGFGETLIFELPRALGKPDSFVRRADGGRRRRARSSAPSPPRG